MKVQNSSWNFQRALGYLLIHTVRIVLWPPLGDEENLEEQELPLALSEKRTSITSEYKVVDRLMSEKGSDTSELEPIIVSPS